MRSASSEDSPERVRVRLALMLAAAVFALTLSSSCSRLKSSGYAQGGHALRFFAMGTLCVVRSDISDLDSVEELVRAEEMKYSPYIDGSLVSEINRNAGIAPVSVPDDFLGLLKKSMRLYEITEGNFSVMLGAATSLYRDGSGEFCAVPNEDELDEVAIWDLTNADDLLLDEQAGTVFLKKKGESLDLGAIAKGWIVDEAVEHLKAKGCSWCLVNFGGDIRVFGERDFRIGIQDPDGERGEHSRVVTVRNKSVVTSGAYERSFSDAQGTFYHHILDPTTLRPCRIINKSVTVICEDADEADAFATALFIDPELLRRINHEAGGIEVVFL